MAQKTKLALEAGGEQVYIIARMGQDLTKYGLTYSHLGLIMRAPDDNQFTVYHELNECGTAQSKLYAQGLLEFFGDGLYKYQAALVTLPKDIQARVVERLLGSPKAFHEPSYSVVAYSFSTVHQNSNQWLLETLAGAMSTEIPLKSRDQAQSWLKAAGFEPTELNIGPLERLGGRMFKAQVAFDDHPTELRFSDRIRTTTAESVFEFLKARYPQSYRLQTVTLQ